MDILRRLKRFAFSMLLVPALPIAQAFTTGFTVANRTGQALLITPIGRDNRDRQRALLPVVESCDWPMDRNSGCRLRVESGQAIEIFYRWDGIRLSEIVVEAEEGHPLQLVAPPAPHYEIADLGALVALSPEVQAAFARAVKQSRRGVLDWCMLVPLLPVLLTAVGICLVLLLLGLVVCLVRGVMRTVRACRKRPDGGSSSAAEPAVAPHAGHQDGYSGKRGKCDASLFET